MPLGQLQALPNSVFLQPEFATTAVPIAMGAGGLMALQQNNTNTALLTFNSAHGYTATVQPNGTTLIQNVTTNHVPSQIGTISLATAGYLLFQLSGATVNTAVNGFTMAVLAIPSTTTMLVACPVTGAAPTVTAANFNPVFALEYGDYDMLLGANCAVQYNPDNTGSPYLTANQGNVVPAPTFRQLQAVSTANQLGFDGLSGQQIVIANGGAGTSRWSQFFR